MFDCLLPLLTVYSSPNIQDIDLNYASDEVKRVFEWAFNNDWHQQNWPIIDEGGTGDGDIDLSTRAISISVSAPDAFDGEFSKVLRIKSTSDEAIVFAEVRPLRRTAAGPSTCQ